MSTSTTTRVDPRTARSLHALREAVLDLASRQDPSAIPVTDLVKAAGVSRKTFYNHATSPVDLLKRVLMDELDAARDHAESLFPMEQALLALFASRQLTLPQAEVEAFAKAHGTLRNQLIDSLNDACYELLDDVLVEESGDGYTIYEAYYQRLIAA